MSEEKTLEQRLEEAHKEILRLSREIQVASETIRRSMSARSELEVANVRLALDVEEAKRIIKSLQDKEPTESN